MGVISTFNYTGSVQTMSLAAGLYLFRCWGAEGEGGYNAATPGKGGYAEGSFIIEAIQDAKIYVGGKGRRRTAGDTGAGWNGGGGCTFANNTTREAGGGGGASDIRIGGVALTDRVIVAAGGGGGGARASGLHGGDGGGLVGADGVAQYPQYGGLPGRGGTQIAGGVTGGALGIGATATRASHGGGGGGYYGGGFGNTSYYAGGGGGSSYIGGVADGATTAGLRSGHGLIEIEYMGPLNYKTSGYRISEPIDISNMVQDITLHWTETKPENTTVIVETAVTGETGGVPDEPVLEDWVAQANGESISNMPEVLADKHLWIKISLATTDDMVSPIVSALWIVETTPDPRVVQINLTHAGRMKYPQGQVTLNFTGLLTGQGGVFVGPFIESFVPDGIVPFFNPHEQMSLEVASVDVTFARHEITNESHEQEPEYAVEVATASIAVVRTHIDDIIE